MKYLGVGLSRTGTTSLTFAFRYLGYESWHYCPEQFDSFLYEKKINYNIFEKVDVVTDIPAAILFREFKNYFPNLKAILTIREEKEWLESLKNHYSNLHERIENLNVKNKKYLHKFAKNLKKLIYGEIDENCIKIYREHNNAVIDFFSKDDLLIMDITKGDGWEKLCVFINEKIPNLNFPNENKKYIPTKKIKIY